MCQVAFIVNQPALGVQRYTTYHEYRETAVQDTYRDTKKMSQDTYRDHILYSIILWHLIVSYKIYKNSI